MFLLEPSSSYSISTFLPTNNRRSTIRTRSPNTSLSTSTFILTTTRPRSRRRMRRKSMYCFLSFRGYTGSDDYVLEDVWPKPRTEVRRSDWTYERCAFGDSMNRKIRRIGSSWSFELLELSTTMNRSLLEILPRTSCNCKMFQIPTELPRVKRSLSW